MNSPTHETTCITLSQAEGQRLFAFLTELIETEKPETDRAELDELLDKVGDGLELARWLREHVNLELECREAAQVQAILESMSPERSVTS